MQGLVSIVVPAFNRGFIIREALDSILEQTYQNWEALVVNDGSTDDTSEVVREYARKDSRIHLLDHDRQKGAQAARNTGLRAAKGQWVAFLDSDDRWLPCSLEARLLHAKATSMVVHSECFVLYPGSTELKLYGMRPVEGVAYRKLLKSPGPVFPALLVSKEALTRIGFLDETIVSYQEWDTVIRLSKHYEFCFVEEPTFIYDCRHSDSISKDSLREARGYEQVFRKHQWATFRYLGPKALASHYERTAALYRASKQMDSARRCSIRARMWWPFRLPLQAGKRVAKQLARWTHLLRYS